jgi:hypothetical protein
LRAIQVNRAIAAAALVAAFAGAGLLASIEGHASAAQDRTVDFNRDIRPIFNAKCVACHGGVKQASGVSFSYREQVLGKGKSGRPVVVPGNPRASELMARITAKDPAIRMPLQGHALPPDQIALLRQWIEQGAPWQNYWAFVAPKPQALPAVKRQGWVRQPLDRFILARLEKQALSPSPEADKAELLRRVSLDLTGLPPTPEALAAFLADNSPDAYEKQVDRLLASPRFGERWASMWLDLARYADSKGFDKDPVRPGVWTYRDWVIDAFNQNMPYDKFVIEQLAGDLLPNPTPADRIASSFNRQTVANDEAGIDDEEYRVAAVLDRNATTWSVVSGITMNCVQCHSHPYDPIRHVEYYKSLAFFNTSRDANIHGDKNLGDDWPVLRVAKDAGDTGQVDHLQQTIGKMRGDFVNSVRAAEADEKQWKLMPIEQGSVNEILALQRALADIAANKKAKDGDKAGKSTKGDKGEKVAKGPGGKAKDPLKLAANSSKAYQLAKGDKAAAALDPDAGGPDKKLKERLVIALKEGKPPAGFRFHDGIAEKTGTVPANAVIELKAPITTQILTALRIEVPPADPKKARYTPEKGFVVNRIDAWLVQKNGQEQKVGFRLVAPDSRAGVEANFVRLLRNDKSPEGDVMLPLAENSGFLADPNLFHTAWAVVVPDRPINVPAGSSLKLQLTQTETANESLPVPRVRLSATSDPRWTAMANDPALDKKLSDMEEMERNLRKIPTVSVPVMSELAPYETRATLEFDRGSFLSPVGPELTPDTPAVFPKMPANAPHNRLTLAKWFFQPGQPLTARVAVNRYWEQLFGTGIVETLEDFGSAGELPSHPELLDWLALHFQNDLHWDSKALLREIVTSATYRQSARTTPQLQKQDPRNRLLARGPQQRLTAEMVRDQALTASGLISTKMGGPSVMPPQPDDVWGEITFTTERWVTSAGDDKYRRAVYTYIKRTATYPSFGTFDLADRDHSIPRRIPTNTPLQALVTLNDPVYHEAAQALAKQMSQAAPGKSEDAVDARLNYGARAVLTRDLTTDELEPLRKLYRAAGATAAASALFNLDAAFTR